MSESGGVGDPGDPGERAAHLWFASQLALGFCLLAGGFFMVPAYLGSQGVSSGDVGLVMSLMGVGALVSPILGRAADTYAAHRLIQVLGVGAAALGCLGFALAQEMVGYGFAALVLGLGQAGVMSMNASLVMGSGSHPAVQARAITVLAAMLQLGQMVGLLIISLGTSAGLSYSALFGLLAAVAFVAMLVTAATNQDAARRVAARVAQVVEMPEGTEGSGGGGRVGLATVAASALGAFLLAATLSQTGQMAIETQLPIYMDGVYGIDAGTVSAVLSLAAALCLVSFVPIARWAAGSGPMPAWLLSQALRLVGMTVLVVLGITAATVPAAAPLAVYVVVYLSYPLFNASAPIVVGRLAAVMRVGIGEAQGLYVGALAVCGIAGPMLGGWVAGVAGLAALPWVPLSGAAGALVVTLLVVRPAMVRHRDGHVTG